MTLKSDINKDRPVVQDWSIRANKRTECNLSLYVFKILSHR